MSHDAKLALKVIGIGSPFGGDAVGFEAIERLRKERNRFPAKTELLSLDRPGSSLVSLLEDAKTVVLIDAMQSGQPPGTVQRIQLTELLAEATHPSSHSLGVAEALALAKALGVLPEKILIYGIEMDESGLKTSWYSELLRLLSEDISG